MSNLTRCLLDKVTARHILEGLLRLAEGRDLQTAELFALDLYERASTEGIRLFIVPSTERVLQRLEGFPRYASIIRLFRSRTEVVFPTRYFRRWTRRLRGRGFSREDAAVLALATFGTAKDAQVLGMHFVATQDQPMIRQWAMQQTLIQDGLYLMQRNLPAPYCHALLPQVRAPEFVDVQTGNSD
jgi:hypothetical protein